MRHRIISLAASATLVLGLVAAGGSAALANDDDGHPCHPHADPVTILGTTGDDRLVGTDCDDLIVAFAGNDRVIGRFGEDTLRGGRGNDRLRAVDGEVDQVNGGSGFDRCVGDLFFDNFRRCEVVISVVFGG